MALRLSFAAIVAPLPFLFAACGDSTQSPAGAAGASPVGVISGPAGSGGGVAQGGSGGIGASAAGTAASGGGASAAGTAASSGGTGTGFGGGGSSGNGGQSGRAGAAGSAGSAGVGGAVGGSTSTAGSAGTVGGIPTNWITVDGIDYSKVPGPNFETVRLLFLAAQCSGSSCHFGGRNHLQVGKTADQLYTYMIGFKTLECGKLIDTANPAQSALVKYLRGPCGDLERMPQYTCVDDGDEACVPEYYIQLIEQWIASGAPR